MKVALGVAQVGEIVKNRGLMVCITIGSAQSQMLELSEKRQAEVCRILY